MKTALYHHRLVVSYKGTNYFGWQDIGTDEQKPTQKPTIEANILQVLKKICKYKLCTIATASRTDAGVHAQGQVLKVSIELAITSVKLLLGMNSLLPDDIRVLTCDSSSTEFNPNLESKSKEYHYYFSTDTVYNPVINDIITNAASLNIVHIQEACKLFVGKHDFYSFAKRDSTMHSTLRTIISCEILQTPTLPMGNEIYTIKIVGTGFLRYMIRYIVGALFALGRNKISLNDISKALDNPTDEKLSPKAKAKGLHLIEVFY